MRPINCLAKLFKISSLEVPNRFGKNLSVNDDPTNDHPTIARSIQQFMKILHDTLKYHVNVLLFNIF